jgi:hypothetical protein
MKTSKNELNDKLSLLLFNKFHLIILTQNTFVFIESFSFGEILYNPTNLIYLNKNRRQNFEKTNYYCSVNVPISRTLFRNRYWYERSS